MPIKRLNYFTHQFLREQDFKDEQAYHIEMRRRHSRLFHTWGVVEGLNVVERGPQEIVVEPGAAIDQQGREIFLQEAGEHDLSSFSHDSEAWITINYHEEETDRTSSGGIDGHTRIAETAVVHSTRHDQMDPSGIVLARVLLGEHGHIRHIDMDPGVRKHARVNAGTGWLRMPFKPARLNPIRIQGAPGGGLVDSKTDKYDFIVDESTAYCWESARGSMEIPVPPGAIHLSGFRVAGVTDGRVEVRLFRTGWNVKEGKPERSPLLEEVLEGESFHKEFSVHSTLDDSHALAVSIHAQGKTEIWLVAVRFE